jgi:TIR domain
MTASLFISYSRLEAPFVDILLDALEDKHVNVWVDYQSLIPGRPWLEQILTGIKNSDIFLLVISKASIRSKNVELEIRHALEEKKRIILAVFESVELPESLQTCEWVDFRGSFNKNIQQLFECINDQPSKMSAVPPTGFKTSSTVWITLAVSLITVLISIPAWWTLFIPILLVPLPFQILKRNFHFYRVRFAVLTLPVILVLSWSFFLPYQFTNVPFTVCLLISFLTSPILLFLLSSRGMRIWGKPSASAPKHIHYRLEISQPAAVPFFMEYAPEDRKFGEAIIKGLKKYAHPQVTDAAQAQVNFVIISHYKKDTSLDPEKTAVFPIIVQDTTIEDSTLQRIQWIDFRRGLRNLNNLAILLPEPAKLMKALGVIPINNQVVYPRIIQMLDYFLTLLAFFSVSIWIPLWLEFSKQFLAYDGLIPFIVINVILSTLIIHAVFSSRQALVHREGKLASLGRLIVSVLWIGFNGFVQTIYVINVVLFVTGAVKPELTRGTVIIFLPLSFVLGIIFISLFAIWNFNDLTLWFPYKGRQ